jgi:serine/threonine protein kinase
MSANTTVCTPILYEGQTFDGYPTVNEYVVKKQLAKGVATTVFLATNADGKVRAIKKYNRECLYQRLADPASPVASLGELAQAVEVMCNFRHRNILSVDGVIDDGRSSYLYLIMQYAAKGPLATIDGEGQCYPTYSSKHLAPMLAQTVKGLNHLHRQGLAHGGIRPENLLRDVLGSVMVADYAISGLLSAPTAYYNAPEMQSTQPVATQAADVWALGVTFYALLAGRVPFHGNTRDATMTAARHEELTFPSCFPAEWKLLVAAMLQKNPVDRISVREIKQRLEAPQPYYTQEEAAAPPSPSSNAAGD